MKRLAFFAAFVALLCGAITSSAPAASFDDTTPCPADAALLVCPTFQVGQPVSLQLRALAGCDIYRWEITNGSLPAGLKMNDDGLITGSPQVSGSTSPWITVHDRLPEEGGNSWCAGDNHSERQFVFNVAPGLSIQDQSVPGGTVGQPYSKQLTVLSITSSNPVQGSPTTATWSVASGSLPAGVTLSSAGLLSGTPTAEGSYTFVVKAAGGGTSTDTETETLNVRQPVAVSSPLTAPTKSEVGVEFSVASTATGGTGTYTWSVGQGALPAGLALGADGSITGTLEVAGRFAFTLTATDSESRATGVNVTLVVAAKLAIGTTKLRAGKAGVAYRAKIGTLGGVAPMTWTIRGKLPKGVTFAKRTATLAGKPKKAGNYRITVQALDALSVAAQKTFVLVVKK